MQLLKTRLKNFKLSGVYNNLEERLSYAQEKSLSYSEFLELLLEDEEDNRRANSYKKDILRPDCRLTKILKILISLFSPLSINALLMTV